MSADSEIKQRAIAMLAAGATQVETSEECGVADRTIRRWVKEPEFAAAVEALSDGIQRSVQARLYSLAGTAIETLANIAMRGAEDKDRVAAARIILDRIAPTKKDVNVTGKLEAETTEQLEARLARLGFAKR